MSLEEFYRTVRGHRDHVEQYRSLLRLGQERYPYKRALQLAQRGQRLLDWGCGNGHLSYFLAHNGFAVDAYDTSIGNFSGEKSPPLLRDMPGVTFTLGRDPVRLPYETETFDLIFGSGVLEHVHEFGGDQAGSIRELARVLKPGGTLWVFHLPNRWSWNENIRGLFGMAVHSRLYTRADFSALIEGSGLEIVEAKRYHFLPRIVLERLSLADDPSFCEAFDALDDAFAFVLAPIAQNWSFITRKSP